MTSKVPGHGFGVTVMYHVSAAGSTVIPGIVTGTVGGVASGERSLGAHT